MKRGSYFPKIDICKGNQLLIQKFRNLSVFGELDTLKDREI